MHIILVPGLWLDGSAWDDVAPMLALEGHTVAAVTLPGMGADDRARPDVTMGEMVDAVVAEVDKAPSRPMVVGHSAGCAVAWAVADRRPEAIARVVLVGGFPPDDGELVLGSFSHENGRIEFVGLQTFEDEGSLEGMDDAARQRLVDNAIPAPAAFATDPIRLTDPRRYDVPLTLLCPEFTAEQARGWAAESEELQAAQRVEYVDLGGSHWPMFSNQDRFVDVILELANRPS